MTTDELIKRVDEMIAPWECDGMPIPSAAVAIALRALRSLRTAVVALKAISDDEFSENSQEADEALDEIKKGWAE